MDNQPIEHKQKLMVDPNSNFYHSVSPPGSSKTYGDIHVRVVSLEQREGYYIRRLTLQVSTIFWWTIKVSSNFYLIFQYEEFWFVNSIEILDGWTTYGLKTFTLSKKSVNEIYLV